MAIRVCNGDRLDRWFGRRWRAYTRCERRVAAWLIAQSVPAPVAAALLWIAKLAALGVLLYVAFWLTLLVGEGR